MCMFTLIIGYLLLNHNIILSKRTHNAPLVCIFTPIKQFFDVQSPVTQKGTTFSKFLSRKWSLRFYSFTVFMVGRVTDSASVCPRLFPANGYSYITIWFPEYRTISPDDVVVCLSSRGKLCPMEPTCSKPPYIDI